MVNCYLHHPHDPCRRSLRGTLTHGSTSATRYNELSRSRLCVDNTLPWTTVIGVEANKGYTQFTMERIGASCPRRVGDNGRPKRRCHSNASTTLLDSTKVAIKIITPATLGVEISPLTAREDARFIMNGKDRCTSEHLYDKEREKILKLPWIPPVK